MNAADAQSTASGGDASLATMAGAQTPSSSTTANLPRPTFGATPGAAREPTPFVLDASDMPGASSSVVTDGASRDTSDKPGVEGPHGPVVLFVPPAGGSDPDASLTTFLANAPIGPATGDVGPVPSNVHDDRGPSPIDVTVATPTITVASNTVDGGQAGNDGKAASPEPNLVALKVPEPGSFALVLLAGAAMLVALRRRTPKVA